MLNQILAVVFDVDGLMLDTERISSEIWCAIVKEQGYDFNLALFKKAIGTWDSSVLYKEFYGAEFDYFAYRTELFARYRKFITTNDVPVKPGLIDLLHFLKEKNLKLGVASSSHSEVIVPMLKNANVFHFFDVIVCGDMVSKGKPDPEIYRTAAERLDIPPEQCIALEDSGVGIQAAYAAKMYPVMVPDMHEPDPLVSSLLYAKCDTLTEVIYLLKSNEIINKKEG